MCNRLFCINCGRKCSRKQHSSKSCFRPVSDKKYRWLHTLLKVRGIKLQPEMTVCNQCRSTLYRENKRRRASDMQSVPNTDDLTDDADEGEEAQQQTVFSANVVFDNIYGNGDDYIYCAWFMKPGDEMTLLSLYDRMTLTCQHNLYTSSNVRRCTTSCCDTPRKRPHERTRLSVTQATDLINDLIIELSRVKTTPIITENDTTLSNEDYLSWTAGH